MPHTPGPWTWWTSNSWRRLRHDDRGKSVDVLMPCIAPDGQPDITVSKDDMVLIAAAPDLLAALKIIIDTLENACSGYTPGSGYDLEWGKQRDTALKDAHAAIAKAEGRLKAGG
jgi:hypothetical protein